MFLMISMQWEMKQERDELLMNYEITYVREKWGRFKGN